MEMVQIAEFINEAINNNSDEKALHEINDSIKDFASKFPLYAELIKN